MLIGVSPANASTVVLVEISGGRNTLVKALKAVTFSARQDQGQPLSKNKTYWK